MQVIYDEKVPVFSFTFGIPDAAWINKLKARGTVLMGTATHIEEALLLEKNKIDYIVAQGSEAGGIMDNKGIAAALSAGATAVQIGTRHS